jgi:hypothetical protein
MKTLTTGTIVTESALKFFNRIIKTREEGRHMSANTIQNQPWVNQLFDNNEHSRTFGLIIAGQYKTSTEIITPDSRVSGSRNLRGYQPMPKITVFTLISTGGSNAGLKLNIAFKTEGKYLTFYYML